MIRAKWAFTPPDAEVDVPATHSTEILPQKRTVPLSLRIFAFLMVLEGATEIVRTVASLLFDRFYLNLTVLNVWAGLGLLRFRRGWRTLVLFQLWIVFIAAGMFAGALLADGPSMTLSFFWGKATTMSDTVAWLLIVGALVLAAWGYWVLTRPQTRALFYRQVEAPSETVEAV